MNKKILLFLAIFVLLLSFSGGIEAAAVPLCQVQNPTGPATDIDPAAFDPIANNAPANSIPNFISNGSGLVPCGISVVRVGNSDKVLCPCQLSHLFIMLLRVFKFLLLISTTIGALMIAIGGVLILLAGANPNWAGTGRTMILWSVIGVITMFCAWLIINILMKRVLGIGFDWTSLF